MHSVCAEWDQPSSPSTVEAQRVLLLPTSHAGWIPRHARLASASPKYTERSGKRRDGDGAARVQHPCRLSLAPCTGALL